MENKDVIRLYTVIGYIYAIRNKRSKTEYVDISNDTITNNIQIGNRSICKSIKRLLELGLIDIKNKSRKDKDGQYKGKYRYVKVITQASCIHNIPMCLFKKQNSIAVIRMMLYLRSLIEDVMGVEVLNSQISEVTKIKQKNIKVLLDQLVKENHITYTSGIGTRSIIVNT
jgi:transcription initiation factor IIE alpha subunit